MNRTEIVALVVEAGVDRRDAQTAVDTIFGEMSRALAGGERVQIRNFGSFTSQVIPSRMVRNPATGERKRAKKSGRVKFAPSDLLKSYVTGVKKVPRVKRRAVA